jgi:hypothetical protein
MTSPDKHIKKVLFDVLFTLSMLGPGEEVAG